MILKEGFCSAEELYLKLSHKLRAKKKNLTAVLEYVNSKGFLSKLPNPF